MTKQDLEHHLAELELTLEHWDSLSDEERAFERLKGTALEDVYLDHMRKYCASLRDHIRYGNHTWIQNEIQMEWWDK